MRIKEVTIAFTTVGFPVGNICAPLLTEMFFLIGMRHNSYRGSKKTKEACSVLFFTFRYI
jgi:hypothetical protein